MRQASALLQRIGRAGRWNACALLLLLLALSFIPTGNVFAQCTEDGSSPGAQGTVTFNPPSTITVPLNTAANTVLWTSPAVTPSPTPVYDCYGTVEYGVVNNVGASPAANVVYFPTGVTGLSYELVHSGASLYSWPNSSENIGGFCIGNFCYGGSEVTFSDTTVLELVATGQIANGSTLGAGVLGYWQWQGFNSNPQIEIFSLGNSVTFVSPACSATTDPINVTLPAISTTTLTGKGSTAGTTAFSIALTCPSGATGVTMSIQLNYNGTASGVTGVLLPTSGSSQGVGVQILNQSSNPVTFGTSVTVGTTTSSMSIPYYARYYQTGAVTAGTLTASATFTLSYQ
jgi:type 1 fimbria pilin